MWKLLFYLVPAALMIFGLAETYVYTKIKKVFHRLPVVAATITCSRLVHHTNVDGKLEIGAVIKYKYQFRGREYEAETPVLKGYDLFPSLFFYQQLVKDYPLGEVVNARVVPTQPEMAYLIVAPLSKASTILVPLISIGSILLIVGYAFGLGSLVEPILDSYCESRMNLSFCLNR